LILQTPPRQNLLFPREIGAARTTQKLFPHARKFAHVNCAEIAQKGTTRPVFPFRANSYPAGPATALPFEGVLLHPPGAEFEG